MMRSTGRTLLSATAALALLGGSALAATPSATRPHNVILFVADGLRASAVSPASAPAMAELARRGVFFQNSHALYPTLTTPNASALATGHLLGDTGEHGNTIALGFNSACLKLSPIGFVENDCVLGDLDDHYDEGNYLDETSALTAAQAAGYSTAAIGKIGPAAIQAVTARLGDATIVIDDQTGKSAGGGVVLAEEITQAIRAAGLPDEAPVRGDNGDSGDAYRRGTHFANTVQQDWFKAVATRVLLPRFKAAGRPFAMVFWSRDPDGSQHNQGDSFQSLTPGIDGPTSLAAIRNADGDLAALLAALRELGMEDSTDVIVTADHGFSTISKQSKTSAAVAVAYEDTPVGSLPPGFVALDLAKALDVPLFEPTGSEAIDPAKGHPKSGDALLGPDAKAPQVLVAANGGTDLIYIPPATPKPDASALAGRIVAALQAQDYTGGLFVRDDLGPVPGTLPMSAVGLIGRGLTPVPAVVLGFRSFSTGCDRPLYCGAEVADTGLQQGQGMHGSFSRADTNNFMAAIGPDFKAGYVDAAPASNADLGATLARLLRLKIVPKGEARGRVLEEALVGHADLAFAPRLVRSEPGPRGLVMTLKAQTAGGVTYYDAAGYPGRVLGLDAPAQP